MPFTLNPNRDGFDMSLELLALLPRYPKGVPLELVALDLGMKSHRQVRELFTRLDERRVTVKTFRASTGETTVPSGNLIAVDERSWSTAQQQAREYVERMETNGKK